MVFLRTLYIMYIVKGKNFFLSALLAVPWRFSLHIQYIHCTLYFLIFFLRFCVLKTKQEKKDYPHTCMPQPTKPTEPTEAGKKKRIFSTLIQLLIVTLSDHFTKKIKTFHFLGPIFPRIWLKDSERKSGSKFTFFWNIIKDYFLFQLLFGKKFIRT